MRWLWLALMLCIATVPLTGCDREATVTYVDVGATYTKEQTQSILERTSTEAVASRTRQEAVGLRHEALVELRSQGGGASEAADTITRVFPATTESVPLRVERATVDEIDALVIVEAWGKTGGHLTAKRLWILDAESDEVLFSASLNSGG